jgi:hypothetical protein
MRKFSSFPSKPSGVLLGLGSTALVLLVVFSGLSTAADSDRARSGTPPGATLVVAPDTWSVGSLRSAPLAVAPDTEPGFHEPGAVDLGPAPVLSLTILISFPAQHSGELASLIAGLSDPNSALYRQYLNASEFDAAYGGSSGTYASAVSYFESFGVGHLQSFADRLTLTFQVSTTQVGQIFHTTIDRYVVAGQSFLAPLTAPELPAPLARAITGVEGLSTYSHLLIHADPLTSVARSSSSRSSLPSVTPSGYLAPVTASGAQFEYGPDFQVAYDERSLFADAGSPKNAVIATILWAGANNSSTPVGPFVPADVYDFFNETFPAGEPHPQVFGVALNGAAPPGPSASYDSTLTNVESTLDLEMAGSTAPGASIYEVYGPNATYVNLDAALSYILNPSHTSGLANVSVISNSWGGADANDTAWYTDLEEAQARGISVLAASGDSGDDHNSSKYLGGPDNTEFPSAMAYDDFGVTAVGGTTVTLNPTPASAEFLHITSQTAWNVSSADTNGGGPLGSTGGISSVFREPSWQLTTSANTTIKGHGRGTPDVAAVANNTLLTITLQGFQFRASNATNGGTWLATSGTSIASPLETGIVAEIDHVLRDHSNGWLGFLNPQLYAVADSEFAPLGSTATTGYDVTGSYSSPLPTLPLLDATTGRNDVYAARAGYDLVTGWGSLDAYNYTMYFLNVSSSGVYGRLSGVEDTLSLQDLAVTSHFHNGVVNTNYNASIQQNFFLANSLGAPVYWVQNVIYITNSSGGWFLTDTGWVIFPFYGLYPSETVYEYNFPAGHYVTFPSVFDVESVLQTPAGFDAEDIHFLVNSASVVLPVPGAAYIIGSFGYNYSWQGVNYTNGPYPDKSTPGGLAPQFGLVGGPSGATGDFTAPTAGALAVDVQPFGSSTFEAATTRTFGENIDQTGEVAADLDWTAVTANQWTLGVSAGSTTQGVLAYEPVTTFSVTFSESGLPLTTSEWSVTLNGVIQSSATDTIVFMEGNGTFAYLVGDFGGWHQATVPYSGTVTVSGSALTEPTLVFARVVYAVAFTENGLSSGAEWNVNFTSGPAGFSLPRGSAVAGSAIGLNVINGTYDYTVGTSNTSYVAVGIYPLTESDGDLSSVVVAFALVTYTVTLNESGLPPGTEWWVNLTNGASTPSTTPVVTLSEPNGTFEYSVGSAKAVYSAPGGSFRVDGGPTSQNISFAAVTFTVTFTENGLATGTEWWVNVSGGPSIESTSNTLSFPEPNGTYGYSADAAGLAYGPLSGAFTIRGAAVAVNATFVSVYLVTFSETGLPAGTNWSMSLGGTERFSTLSTIEFRLPNGVYAFALGAVSGYRTSPSSGNLSVVGASVAQTVTFTSESSAPTFLGLPASEGYALLSIVALSAIAALAIVAVRSRRPAPPR